MGPNPGVRRNDAPSSKVDPLAIPPATGSRSSGFLRGPGAGAEAGGARCSVLRV